MVATTILRRKLMSDYDMKYVFLDNLHHAYAQTDGSYDFPNSREGDMLKQAKKEIEEKDKTIAELKRASLRNMAITRQNLELLLKQLD
jgi:hypothetical protein